MVSDLGKLAFVTMEYVSIIFDIFRMDSGDQESMSIICFRDEQINHGGRSRTDS